MSVDELFGSGEEIRHNCGLCVTHSLHDVYSFAKSLQHRGREAAGIAAISDSRIDVLKWVGGVDKFDIGSLHYIFNGPYHTFMSHVRYATRGRKDQILEDAHPVTLGGETEVRGDHALIRNCDLACVHNGQVDQKYFNEYSEVMKTGSDTEGILHYYRNHGERGVLKGIPGAFTLAIADKEKRDIIVLRDKTGLRPGVLGWKDGNYVMASEDVAFVQNGAGLQRDLSPGKAYYFSPDGGIRSEKVVDADMNFCFFEWNYISNVLSNLNDVDVRRVRKQLGEKLAENFKFEDIDFVTYMPRCPWPAAESFAEAIDKPFIHAFYKMKNERSFMGSTKGERANSIHSNLHLGPGVEDQIRGKRGICVDDSTVRGNNSVRAKHLLYDVAGVSEVILLNYTPKIGIVGEDGEPRGCTFGVDMPPNDDFIARGRTDEQISEKIGMPVMYLPVEAMLEVFEEVGIKRDNLCTYCIGGKHPFEGLES